jgi:RHS repeat-associated protein
LTATEVLEKLTALGCHSTDITDALFAADPEWASKHDEEIARRRLRIQDGRSVPLYDAGARFYAPSLGVFTQADTVAGTAQDPASLNRYLYTAANPASLIDPDGHAYCGPDGILCAAHPTSSQPAARARHHAPAHHHAPPRRRLTGELDAIGHDRGRTILRHTQASHSRTIDRLVRERETRTDIDGFSHDRGRTIARRTQTSRLALAAARAQSRSAGATNAYHAKRLAQEDQASGFSWVSKSGWDHMSQADRRAYAAANGARAGLAMSNGSAYWSDLAVVAQVALTAGTYAGSGYSSDDVQLYTETAAELGGPDDPTGDLAVLSLTLINKAPVVGHDVAGGVAVGGEAGEASSVAESEAVATAGGNSLATGADEAIFWSGVRGGAGTAMRWAASHGGATLESTMASRGIQLPEWDPANPASMGEWRSASQAFASGARGSVRVLQEDSLRINSVWGEIEYPALRAKVRVTSITAIDPRSGIETVLWSR